MPRRHMCIVMKTCVMGPFKCYVTLFFWKLDPHPPPRNANNIEHYTFVTLFSRKSHTPHPHLRYVTLEWPLWRHMCVTESESLSSLIALLQPLYDGPVRETPWPHDVHWTSWSTRTRRLYTIIWLYLIMMTVISANRTRYTIMPYWP